MSIDVRGLKKVFDTGDPPVPALDGVDLQVAAGELLVVVGPSGSGKSTLLRTVAGLEVPDEGTVAVGGKDVTRSSPGDRDVAMVFQDYALYPHLAIRQNIAFPLLARKTPADEVKARVREVAGMLGITEVLDRLPGEVSGGERRRVAVARAVIRGPAAFLMDEPLSNLDANLKRRVQLEIAALQEKLQVTTLYVTHDQTEAMMLGHRIAVLRAGRVEQIGSPLDLYDRPANTFVARFIGAHPMNILPAGAIGGVPGAAIIGLRVEALSIVPASFGRLSGPVLAVDRLGNEVVVEVDIGGEPVMVGAPRNVSIAPGDVAHLDFSDDDLHRFDASGEALA